MNRPYAILAVKSICSAAFPLPGANTHTHTSNRKVCLHKRFKCNFFSAAVAVATRSPNSRTKIFDICTAKKLSELLVFM